jgi:hypothetical protein
LLTAAFPRGPARAIEQASARQIRALRTKEAKAATLRGVARAAVDATKGVLDMEFAPASGRFGSFGSGWFCAFAERLLHLLDHLVCGAFGHDFFIPARIDLDVDLNGAKVLLVAAADDVGIHFEALETRAETDQPAAADDYKMPHNLDIVRAKDPQTGTEVLEFREGKKLQGRMKLLAERTVQEYVSHLGDSLIPEGAKGTRRPIEFRFFVVEDPEINAASLPDGTLLINTGLLGAIENEAQLAFILSHEMAHVLQVHYRREVEETRGSRVGLTIAGLAASAFIGNAGMFMAQIGIASAVNGHQRELENQADRLALQNVIEHGYDPREAPNFSRIIVNRYGNRTTSKLWSNHDSSLIRGSFLTVQLMREYPDGHWDSAKKNTSSFQAMKDDLGPVKIM